MDVVLQIVVAIVFHEKVRRVRNHGSVIDPDVHEFLFGVRLPEALLVFLPPIFLTDSLKLDRGNLWDRRHGRVTAGLW